MMRHILYKHRNRYRLVLYNTSTKHLAIKMLVTSELGQKIKDSRITFSRRKFEEFKINWNLGLQVCYKFCKGVKEITLILKKSGQMFSRMSSP